MREDVAGRSPDRPGVVAPVSLLYVGGLAVGLLLELAIPIPGLPSALSWPLGIALFVPGSGLGLWFLWSFRRAKTPVDVRKPTTAIVTDGPFRFSRNPGYLSLTGMYVGLAVIADALWPLLVLPGVLLAVQRGVIYREERYLERKFGENYLAYRARTRRWI